MAKDPYKDNEAYCTHAEAVEFLQITPHTFGKYRELLGIDSVRAGRHVYFKKKDIERLSELLSGLTPALIMLLEARTGKKIKFVDNDEN